MRGCFKSRMVSALHKWNSKVTCIRAIEKAQGTVEQVEEENSIKEAASRISLNMKKVLLKKQAHALNLWKQKVML